MLECNVDVEIIHFSDFKHQQKKKTKENMTNTNDNEEEDLRIYKVKKQEKKS